MKIDKQKLLSEIEKLKVVIKNEIQNYDNFSEEGKIQLKGIEKVERLVIKMSEIEND